MTPEQLQGIAGQVKDIGLAAMLTIFVTGAVLAWVPRKIGPLTVPEIDGARVWLVVFLAAVGVVLLMSPAARFDRALILAALAVTVTAITGNTALDKLNEMRDRQASKALISTLVQAPPKGGASGSDK
ncbi:MAG: hypothetical protein AB7I38_18625 [Dehalococcoidia bacterium]